MDKIEEQKSVKEFVELVKISFINILETLKKNDEEMIEMQSRIYLLERKIFNEESKGLLQ